MIRETKMGSTWAVSDGVRPNGFGSYTRVFSGEFRGGPDRNPKSDLTDACALTCNSTDNCTGFGVETRTSSCNLWFGERGAFVADGAYKQYTKLSGANPKYWTTHHGAELNGNNGTHTCQGDTWWDDGEGFEVENSGGQRYCIELRPRATRCPSELGAPVKTKWTNQNGGDITGNNFGLGHNNIKVKCGYTSVPETVAFTDSTMANDFDGNSTSGTIKQIRDDICANKNFGDLAAAAGGHAGCKSHYSANGRLNAEILQRILIEKGNSWPDDSNMRGQVLTIAISNAGDGSPATAKNMINTYCLQQNPNWADNANMRAFINELFTNDTTKTNPDLRSAAATIVNDYCDRNPSSSHCTCWKAVTKQFNGCIGDTSPGCAEMNSLNNSFKGAEAGGLANIIAPLKTQLKPICIESSCKTAQENSGGDILRTADTLSMTCQDNIALCLSEIKAGGSIAPGAHISQSCSVSMNITGSNLPCGSDSVCLAGQAQTLTQNAGKPGQSSTTTSSVSPPPPPPSSTSPPPTQTNAATPPLLTSNETVTKYLDTREKQEQGFGGFACCLFICCCCIFLMIMMGGGNGGGYQGPSIAEIMSAKSNAASAAVYA